MLFCSIYVWHFSKFSASHLAFKKKYDLLNFIKIHISLKISLNVNFYKVFSDKGKIKKNNKKNYICKLKN